MKVKMKVKDTRSRLSVLTGVMLVLLVVYCAALLTLIIWTALTALKEPMAFNRNMSGLPHPFYFKNFGYVLQNAKMIKAQGEIAFSEIVWNSLLYSVGCALANTVVTCITAYLCARYVCGFSKFLYSLVLVVMVIPIIGSQTSELEMSIKLGLYDKMLGMVVMRANFLGLYFLVFYDIFKSTPMAFSEAAEIDGAGDMQIMVKIFFPIASNTFLTVLLINFIGYWNNYQVPMVFVPNHPTLAEFLFDITQNTDALFTFVPVQMSASLLLLAPVVILFVAFNKKLLGNLSVGGVKG